MKKTQKRASVSLVVAGCKGSGKSSLVASLLYQIGGIDQRSIQRLQEQARRLGHEDSTRHDLVFYCNRTREERLQGCSILPAFFQAFFADKRDVTLVDAPSLDRSPRNFCRAVAMADLPVVVFPCLPSEEDVRQTRETLRVLNGFGVGREGILCVISKVDEAGDRRSEAVDDARRLFERLVRQVAFRRRSLLVEAEERDRFVCLFLCMARMGYQVPRDVRALIVEATRETPPVSFVDVSAHALEQDLPALHDALCAHFDVAAPHPIEGPCRLLCSDFYLIKGIGDVVAAKVAQGVLRAGTGAGFPEGSSVFTLERHHRAIESADDGSFVGLHVRRIPRHHPIREMRRGFICGEDVSPVSEALVRFVSSIQARRRQAAPQKPRAAPLGGHEGARVHAAHPWVQHAAGGGVARGGEGSSRRTPSSPRGTPCPAPRPPEEPVQAASACRGARDLS